MFVIVFLFPSFFYILQIRTNRARDFITAIPVNKQLLNNLRIAISGIDLFPG